MFFYSINRVIISWGCGIRACVVHNTLNSVGGGERVCLAVIEALKSMGSKVTLITTEPTDWGRVVRTTGIDVRPDREVHLPFRLRYFGIYMRFATAPLLSLERGKCDIVVNTHGDLLPITSDIIYMHYPTFALLWEGKANIKYSKSLFWKIYFYPYVWIQRRLANKVRWRVLLTNSEFSREAIRKYIGAEARVLYPPVDVSEFLKVSGSKDREDRVVSCGRYTPEKNYELVLKVAKELPHVEFVIIGAYSGKVSSTYYTKLLKMKERLGLKNVRLLRNVPRDEQLRIYSKSKVFLHAMIGEHFGIAVVEGMAAGLIPVVHKSGGPWYDIVDRGRYGLGYTSIEEAVDAVEKGLRSFYSMTTQTVGRAALFHKDRFTEEFTSIVKRLVL